MPRERFEDAYKGVLLKCSPTPLQNGRWAPTLIINDQRGGGLTETLIPIIGPAECETEREAADVARITGRKWADDNA